MRRVSVQLAKAVVCGGAPLCFLLAVGCGDSQIKTYRVAKEDNTPKMPASHSADDPHAHGMAGGPAAPSLPSVSWELPKGWESMPADGMRKGLFQISGPGGKTAQAMIIPLPGTGNIELESVNLWRESLGLSPLTKENVTTEGQPVEIGDTKGNLYDLVNAQPTQGQTDKTRTLGAVTQRDGVSWFIKMTGPDELVTSQKPTFVDFLKSLKFEAAAPQPAQVAQTAAPEAPGAPKWQVPQNWQPKAPGPMITAAYGVSGANGEADVTISKFPGDVGGLVANVNRWRRQLGLSELPDTEAQQSAQMLEIGGSKDAYMVDLKGMNARTGKAARMVALGVPRGGETWFYKLLGDDAVVGGEKDAFLKFVKSAE